MKLKTHAPPVGERIAAGLMQERVRGWWIGLVLATAGASAPAQQLLYGVTGPECSSRGGQIRTWTSTAGIVPQRGECYVPPAMQSGRGGAGTGGGAVPGGAGAALGAAGAALGAAGALGSLLDTLGAMQRDKEERDRQWERELQQDRDRWAAESDGQRRDQLAREMALRAQEHAAILRDEDEAARQRASAANPFATGAYKPQPYDNSDPDLARCREGSSDPWTIAGCYNLGAQPRPAARAPSLREQLSKSLGQDADKDAAAAQRNAQDEAGARAMADQMWDASARERYDQWVRGGNPLMPENTRARAACKGQWTYDGTSAGNCDPQAPKNVRALAFEPQRTAAPQAARQETADRWPRDWRTRDESACRAAGGILVPSRGATDLAGIPQVLLDSPGIAASQLAATPYCRAMPSMSSSKTAEEVRRLAK